jgi:2-iminobutanoate/2-iminopropanoate deaminase
MTAKPPARIRRITSPEVPEPQPGTWSNCLLVDGIAYVAGMIASDKDGNILGGGEYEQAKAIFAKIRHLVEAAGGTMGDVVKVTIFVTDIKRREEVWRARREVFTGNFPTSTLVEVRALATPAVKVEVEAVAFIGAGPR